MNTKKMTLTLSALLALTQPNHAAGWIANPGAAGAAAAGIVALGFGLQNGRQGNINKAKLSILEKRVNAEITATNGQIVALTQELKDRVTALERALFGDAPNPHTLSISQEITALKQQFQRLQTGVGNKHTSLDNEINILGARVLKLEHRLGLDAEEDRADQSLRAQVVITAGKIALVETAVKEQKRILRTELENTHAKFNGTLQGLSELVEREVGSMGKRIKTFGDQLDGLEKKQEQRDADLADLRTRMDQSDAHFQDHINRHAEELARLGALNPAAHGDEA